MLLASLYSLTILVILLGAQIWRPHLLLRLSKYAFGITVFFMFFIAGYLTIQQYRVWLASPLARLLLPPHQPIGYFAQYAATHFWSEPAISFAAALLGLAAAKIINKIFEERFFWPAEPWLFAIGLFLTGSSGWLYYILGIFSAGLIGSLINKQRFSFYYLWLPVAIAVIIIKSFL